MTTKQELEQNVAAARAAVTAAEEALLAWSDRAENNVFPTMDAAELEIEEALQRQAREDCEGAHNCGLDKYTRDFMVDGKTYTGTLTVEYNRYDKTYYYVDGSDFTVAEKAIDLASEAPLTPCPIPGNGDACESCQ